MNKINCLDYFCVDGKLFDPMTAPHNAKIAAVAIIAISAAVAFICAIAAGAPFLAAVAIGVGVGAVISLIAFLMLKKLSQSDSSLPPAVLSSTVSSTIPPQSGSVPPPYAPANVTPKQPAPTTAATPLAAPWTATTVVGSPTNVQSKTYTENKLPSLQDVMGSLTFETPVDDGAQFDAVYGDD